MSEFESYTLDQFPLRDFFRTLKAASAFYLFGKKDNNGIYLADGYAAKLEYPLNEASVLSAADKFTRLFDKYLKDSGAKVYLSVVPDKGYFLAEKNGYPALDYNRLVELIRENTGFAEYIDLFKDLTLEDYYKTDTHWRQERLVSVARRLSETMGAVPLGEYTLLTADNPFFGVYYGQSALPLPGEKLHYVTNELLAGCVTVNEETGKRYTGMYDNEKLTSKDPYELFLSGASAVITVENPAAKNEKTLVLFRDSFGSSLAPLLASEYSRITLIDTRYIHPDLVGEFVDFEDADVLFLYSTLILNQSESLK